MCVYVYVCARARIVRAVCARALVYHAETSASTSISPRAHTFTQSIDLLVFDMSLAFDEGKKVKDAIIGAVGGSLAPGRALLYIDGELKWQEQFTAGWALKDGQFGGQCALALAGEPLIANGEPPAEEEGDEDEEEAVVGGDFVDPMAGGGDY